MSNTDFTWEGKTVGHNRYLVRSQLGQGGMGFIYLAEDQTLQTNVVLKVPRIALMQDVEFSKRFLREIRSLVQLSHPQIVKITDVGEENGIPFAVMQYLSGGSLEDRRPRHSDGYPLPMDIQSLCSWIEPIAKALDFVHAQGFVHRDVKPGNILFDQHENAYLSDFGVAKALADSSERDGTEVLTGGGLVLGTPEYIAPEAILGHPYDGRLDQYALAITIFEILTGRLPFRASVPSAVLVQHTTDAVPSLTQLRPEISPAIAQVVHRALEKQPDLRYPNCGEFARHLLTALQGPVAIPVAPPATVPMIAPTPVVQQTIPAVAPIPQPTAIVLPCPNCSQELTVAQQHRDSRIGCPACHASLKVSWDLTELRLAETMESEVVPRKPIPKRPFDFVGWFERFAYIVASCFVALAMFAMLYDIKFALIFLVFSVVLASTGLYIR